MTSLASNSVRLTDVIAPSFYDIHWDIIDGKHTHYWLSGGRGSTKSSFVSVAIIMDIMSDPEANAVVLRKVKDTLNDSVKEQLIWAIEALGVSQYWDMPETKLVLTYIPTGQEIRFRGADKPKKIKSMKFAKGYCKIIWYEELDEFTSMEEVRMINQSLMRGGPKFTVFYSYNPPKSANNWVNTEKNFTRDDRLTCHTNYLTVPQDWLGQQFIIEAEHLKVTKPLAYEHEYLGNVVGTGGEVFDNVQTRRISDEEIEEFYNIKRGLDFGYAIDPLAYTVSHYDAKHRILYIYHELYKVRLSNREAYEHIQHENKDNGYIYADSAEPKSISELLQYGLRIGAVKKGPDSIEYGIRFLQSLNSIVIDDTRCPETAREFLTYELDKDANGNFKAGYPDKNNHSIDSVRYAMNDEAIDFRDKKKQAADYDNSPEARVRRNIAKQGKPKKGVHAV
ncbi:PBSX family phage terminase large subunit [Paenibacillus sabinae]|uniref:PBSX family phage terminase large subunit n=1 Tax=Paenibacillus sabinae T27 TaxID=1268072 RepID=X4ZFB7_9BACL|nr:PBSX family phage terminase large subunit [Paenibacillus sabinae]AHV96147.1 PBSX family phage terminase large subunit [Paenibacillus sabinae T27]